VEETKVGVQEVLEEVQDLVADLEVADHLVDSEEVDLVVEETKVGVQEVLEEVQDLVADLEVGDHLVDSGEVDLVVEETKVGIQEAVELLIQMQLTRNSEAWGENKIQYIA
jgi:hypothetical protein